MGQRTSDTVNQKSPSMFGSTEVAESPETGTEITEVSESTNLSPLMAETLKLQDRPESNIGIETTWTDANGPTSERAIPLSSGQTNDFTDVGADPIGSDTGIEHGPFPPSSSTQNNHFETGDIQHDSPMETETNIPGVCGLENLGNTCFMAAGLQCLTATPPVVQHFLKLQKQRGDKFLPSGTLMDHFSDLLGKIWCGKYKVVKPIEFKNTLGAYHTQFKDYRQHDCQEFLALLLDSLHEQMNTAKIGKNSNISANASTANMLNSIEHQDTKLHLTGSAITATHKSNYRMNSSYDRSPSPDNSNSPICTQAGTPRDSPTLDSTANSVRNSPLIDAEDDEETLDSVETAEAGHDNFIHNRMDEDQSLRRQQDDEIHGGINSTHRSLQTSKALMAFSEQFSSPQYSLQDIFKEAKTSNANFSVPLQECNNAIHYDSGKFPKENVRRTPLNNSNLTENHDFDNKSVSVKRIKEVNVFQNMNHTSTEFDTDGFSDTDTELEKCNVKRMKLDDYNMSCSGGSKISQYNGAVADQEEIEADEHWIKHLQSNHSIIVDTFQGQFKSTVVCAVCKHVSVTYEPFMYLSVPLPHAMERQLTVTYVPTFGKDPIKCIVSMNKQLGIGKFKEELLKTLCKEDVELSKIAVAEVLNNHIARILDDNTLLRDVNDTNRDIYAFELTDPPEPYNTALNERGDQCAVDTESLPTTSTDTFQCTICLSDDIELQRLEGDHSHEKCYMIMCNDCLGSYYNKEETVKCWICRRDFTSLEWIKISQSRLRILNVPVIFRHDSNNETTNNHKNNVLYSHPLLLRLPSSVNAKDLYEVIAKHVPEGNNYTIHFVEGQGQRCSRCIWPQCCTGCHIPETGEVLLSGNDTIAVRYMGGEIPKIGQAIDHISVNKQRPPHPLSLHDCLQAFSQSETLDEHNPWFCPKCECNRCATKTLTVHRYPKFLIVYLKRFVFYESTSMKLDNKVKFPLDNLSVGQHLYDLYACVCHFGGLSAGHYTAYAKNPNTDEWFYYNDDHVTCRQTPQDDDFSNAYILFYRRQGTNFKPCNT